MKLLLFTDNRHEVVLVYCQMILSSYGLLSTNIKLLHITGN